MKDILFNIIWRNISAGDVERFSYNDIDDSINLYGDTIRCEIAVNKLLIIFFTDDHYIHIEYTYNFEAGKYGYKFDNIKHNSESNIQTDEYIKKANEYISRHKYAIWLCRQFVISMFRNR